VRPKQQFNPLQTGQPSAYLTYPKPHAHIMLTQMSVKAGIEKIRHKGNNTLLKE